MTRLVFASFYTPEYVEEAAGLVESLAARGIAGEETRVEPVESLGRWETNCQRKPAWLAGVAGSLLPGDRLVWLDADARIDADPRPYFRAVPDAVDLAAHWRAGAELLSGTLYLRVGDGARLLLDLWDKACRAAPGAWDQRILQQVVHRIPNLVAANLPAEFCAIPDRMPGVQPTIRHRQASRRLKMTVGP